MKRFAWIVLVFLLSLAFPPAPAAGGRIATAPAGALTPSEQHLEPVALRPILLHDTPPPEVEAAMERAIAAHESRWSGSRVSSPPAPYPFFPQAGNLWGDLPAPNFVDLDPTTGLLDWDCSQYTYNGHTGMDTPIVGFRTQSVGVPIYAALDGVVVDAHDGEIDTITNPTGSAQANYVVLDHGNTQYTYYYHLKRNSVAVSPGEAVVAGQQIGLTGSSGYSSWPHLHFATRFNGRAFEPYAGGCRPGESGWSDQVPVRRDPYAFDLCFSASGFGGDLGLPWDKAQRTGAFPAGNRQVHLQIEGANLPSRAVLRFRFQRPDGSEAAVFVSESAWPLLSFYVVSYSFAVPLDPPGPWRLLIEVDGLPFAEAPFAVVSSPAEIVNRPPHAVTLALDPPSPSPDEVLFCRVNGQAYGRDPDYDLVSYRYRWMSNGSVLREVTSAGMADALQRDLVRDGETIECTVTPSDGVAEGPASSVRTTVGRRHSRPLSAP